MSPLVDLVILDCDGVLVDSERLAAEVSADMFVALGWDVTADELRRRFTGCTPEQWETAVVATLGDRLDAGWDEELRSRCDAAFDLRLAAVDGVREALNRIAAPSCVASNGGRESTRRKLARVRLLSCFEGRLFTAEDVSRPKPAPDLFLHAADALGARPSWCVVVEDSPTGVRAARAAGMSCLGYVDDAREVGGLAGLGAVEFRHMRDLPALIREVLA